MTLQFYTLQKSLSKVEKTIKIHSTLLPDFEDEFMC